MQATPVSRPPAMRDQSPEWEEERVHTLTESFTLYQLTERMLRIIWDRIAFHGAWPPSDAAVKRYVRACVRKARQLL